MERANLEAILEGLLFVVGDEGLTLSHIEKILEIDTVEAKRLIMNLRNIYSSENRGITISFLGDSFKLTTKKEHKEYYKKLVENSETNTLSQAALETLAIIAYNEPITVQTLDEVRGVNSREMVRRLVAKGLVKEVGKSDLPGRPLLYSITSDFLDYFGLSSKDELPTINMLPVEAQEDTDLYHSKYSESE